MILTYKVNFLGKVRMTTYLLITFYIILTYKVIFLGKVRMTTYFIYCVLFYFYEYGYFARKNSPIIEYSNVIFTDNIFPV